MKNSLFMTAIGLWLGFASLLHAASSTDEHPMVLDGNAMIDRYFRHETQKLSGRYLNNVGSLAEWREKRGEYRRQLREMLGLFPLPERTPLEATVTGRHQRNEVIVENVHFQSMPGLYVTGNLYRPENAEGPAPTVLYVCGHGATRKDGISYGNKVTYRHHGVWFARHGYVCLIIDTLQLGEIEGLHHGTYREGKWWWNARGYTPAGVEAWNGIRALDYLETREEVDADRLGVTGRSGGGVYSWWLAALDERIRVAAPVAGITDLENHVVDGTVEGHCDCMFMVNTYRWDYPMVAAMVVPRPLLLANSDRDSIFPLDGIIRTRNQVDQIYGLHDARDQFGLLITPGSHRDTQDLQVPVFRWFNRHLKDNDPLIEAVATKWFIPEELKVFDALPSDQINTRISESFVPAAAPADPPADAKAWGRASAEWIAQLKNKVFAGWPESSGHPRLKPVWDHHNDRFRFRSYDFTSQSHINLRLYVLHARDRQAPRRVRLTPLDAESWPRWLAAMRELFDEHEVLETELERTRLAGVDTNAASASTFRSHLPLLRRLRERPFAQAWVAPRGIGLTAWQGDDRHRVQIRRRFMLLGQTVAGMRVWDLRQAVHAVKAVPGLEHGSLTMTGRGPMGVNALYAALFESESVSRLRLNALPASHRQGPHYLNVLRFLDIPQAVALTAEHIPITLSQPKREPWRYPIQVQSLLGWESEQLQITQWNR